MGTEREHGQASVELLASLPILAAAALVVFQLLTLGYCSSLADGAAEAGALALAAGQTPREAVRRALPGWALERAEISSEDGEVRVSIDAPSPLEGVGARLSVHSSAWARPPGGG
jgi:hypothetical protein